MRNDRLLVLLALVVGVALIAISIVYFAEPARSLPSFFPGHQAGVEPSPREARDRLAAPGAGRARLRLVPDRPEADVSSGVILAALISYPRAIILGLLQGVSELFPISSLGHAVILPRIFGWDIHQNDKYFLAFLVATHLATAIVLLGFFWRDWVRIVKGLGRSLARSRHRPRGHGREARLAARGRDDPGRNPRACSCRTSCARVFASAPSAAAFLIANGVLLSVAELLRRRAPETEGDDDARIARQVGWPQSFLVGAAQALALIPGFSRSGASMGGGLLVGLSNRDAARFAFLLATPIIGAAAVLKLPELFGSEGNGVRGPALAGALCAAVTAYLAVRFLMRYFETRTLVPFAVYCFAAGIAATIYFAVS